VAYRNPLPVTVVLVPVLGQNGRAPGGLLAVRRAIPPRLGELALPGGYIGFEETWQQAGAREVFEETGLRIAPEEILEYRVRSAPDGTLIIFGAAQPRQPEDLPPFTPNEEASERVVIDAPVRMAFGLHEEMLRLYLQRGLPAQVGPAG
jgi:ADP-ribose pyrophosphatase YjhB (NUDIX family)